MAFTPFPALDAVLDELVTRPRKILGANFLGAYLQGSFAVGDADEHSDVEARRRSVGARGGRSTMAPLIQQALDGRPDPWKRVHETVDEARASATRAFVDYAISVAGLSGRLLTSSLNSDDGDE